MEKHYAAEHSLQDLAARAHCSPRTLLRRFEHSLSISPSHYLQRLRIAAAQEKLAVGKLPVEIVAEQVGYRDRAAFAKAFKRITGMSPAAYRDGRAVSGKATARKSSTM
jgi:transcriptional regulator GlxA family with amidase domain